MKRILGNVLIVVLLVLLSASCGIIPDNFNFGIDANVNTTSEIGQNTLDRIDAVNETIASGVEIGPETRSTIEELNKTIANGIKAGFDDDTLSRVDELLRIAEDGLKIGLDSETLTTIDGMVNTIDEMPGNWEASAQDVIQTLENTAGSTAKTLANEVKGVMDEAKVNFQQMTAITGIEFRCNVDFMGSKVGATAQEFIGKSIVGKLKAILSGTKQTETVPVPWVCQVIPDTLTLSQVGDKLVFEDGIITLTGYNYVEANKPAAIIVDESGAVVPGIPLYPYLSSPYQIQLNMQELDFNQIPARSRVVFKWPNVEETSGIAILLPGHSAPIASFSSDKISGNAPLTVNFTDTSSGDPVAWEWVFGDGGTSLEQNPSHQFIDSRDFQVQLTASNAQGQSSVIKTISVGTQLTADFTYDHSSGDDFVQFHDKSTGGPTNWLWDFGDGTPTSAEQNPQHLYLNPNPDGYQVTLTVKNESASSVKTATDKITVLESLKAQFIADKVSGTAPLTVKFTDQSLGGSSILKREWDFGDGSTVVYDEITPTHQYASTGNFDVTLTITRSDGKQDISVKNELINVYKRVMVMPRLTRVLVPDGSVYFTSFSGVPGGKPLDTKISFQKYVCGVNGMAASNGVIGVGHFNLDGLRVYMFPQTGSQTTAQTWWLIADFQDFTLGYLPKETWKVNVVCFSRELEGSVFLYRDDFRNITGGTPTETGIATTDYFNCGIAGVAGLGATGFDYNVPYAIPMEAYLDGSGEEWILHSDMAVTGGGDLWDTRVLCLKKGSYMNVEKPPFVTWVSPYFQTSISTQVDTGISSTDYLCGVNGYKAEKGDIYTIHPDAPYDTKNIAANVVTINTFQKNGNWWIEANLANRFKNEDWTVNVLCVRKPVAVEGMPPG